MTNEQARQILLCYRSEVPEAEDPELAEALRLCERNVELRVWFGAQAGNQAAIRKAFREIEPPAGLREQIISEHRAALRATWWRRPRLLAVAAVIMLFVAGALVWSQWGGLRPNELSLTAFRTRMVKEALRLYRMEMESNDLDQVRQYLASLGYPADFALTKPLQATKVTGCLRTRWQNRNVTMICFLRDKTAPPAVQSDVWLFVMDQAGIKDSPSKMNFTRVTRLSTATWVKDGKIYLLGTEGDEAEIKKLIEPVGAGHR